VTGAAPRIAVTGASGYVAAHVVRELLARGYRVRGSVRGDPAAERFAFLRALPGADARLELVAADLQEGGDWPRVVAGCAAVVHAASPFRIDVADPRRDLIDPAVEGTRHVLLAAAHAGVRRVALTSSFAAVTDQPLPGKVFDESDWNTRSSAERNPYYASKAAAERAAWTLAERHGGGFEVVALNPALVLGPSLGPALSTSPRLVADVLAGAHPAVLPLNWLVVDVREVAHAHVEALERADARGRYILAGAELTAAELVALLREAGLGARYRLPRLALSGPVGTAIAKLAAATQPAGTRSFLRTHLGVPLRADGSRAERELGVRYRPLRETVLDTVADLERWGHLRPRA
jgi:dihydroflavonol-4-reductase